MLRKEVIDLKEVMKKGQVLIPYVYDCLSARMAENTGFKVFAFSTSGYALSGGAVPDMGMLSIDDVTSAAARVVDYLPYPVIAELENGFGATPYIVWHNVRKMVELNPAAVIIDDTTEVRGKSRMLDEAIRAGATSYDQARSKMTCDVVAEDVFYARIRAAVDACKDSGCMVIAASNAKFASGLDESIKRLKKCKEIGADIVMCRGTTSIDDCRAIAAEIDGPKMYDEFSSTDGKPDVDLDEISALGFGLVTVRYLEKAAIWGLMKLCMPCGRDRSLVYNDYHDYDGMLPGMDHHIRLSNRFWNFGKTISETTDARLADK